MTALKASWSPPIVFPDVIGPTWGKAHEYITTGGLQHATNGMVSGSKLAGMKSVVKAGYSGVCWVWSPMQRVVKALRLQLWQGVRVRAFAGQTVAGEELQLRQ